MALCCISWHIMQFGKHHSPYQSEGPYLPVHPHQLRHEANWRLSRPGSNRDFHLLTPTPRGTEGAGMTTSSGPRGYTLDPSMDWAADEVVEDEDNAYVELICIEDSMEVIEISSDLEIEEDPSEVSSLPPV
uniref:Uncharacterized protein n=1 Tax=Lupinus angustifolius TaxID=3871 RepID=A0A182BFB6_LUPAN|nr:hypothetical protein [Lupinus angustifolius]